MDDFAERISKVLRNVADVPGVLFADGMLLSAKSTSGLQCLLDIASKWGNDFQMRWNTKPGKSEVLLTQETEQWPFMLAEKPLNKVREVPYLGISLNGTGVTETKMIDRITRQR